MATALTIDLGTTNLKVGLINDEGEILQLRSEAVPVESPSSGAAEHNPETLKRLILDLCKEVLSNKEVDYIVSSAYQFGLMLLDGDKKPLTGLTLLTDIRSQSTYDKFLETYADRDLYAKTGCPLMSTYSLARLFYFSREREALFRKVRYVKDSKAYLFEWLTGEFVTDISTAAATQIYNIKQQSWDESLLDILGLSKEQFPKIKDGTAYLSPLSKDMCTELGLKKRPQVLLGVYDGASLGIGLGGLAPEVGIINVGTSAMLRVPGEIPAFDQNANKRIQPYALNNHVFLNGGALNNAALPVNWLRNKLFDVDVQDPAILQVKKAPPLLCLPYLTSERDSKTGPYASGVFFGLRPFHEKIDLARAVLEGVAYSMRYLFEAIEENGLQINALRMGGGGVNISPWPQIFANILKLPIEIPRVDQIALIGSAMLAFVADGKLKDISVLNEQMSRRSKKVYPDGEVAHIHDDRYRFFKQLRETLGPLYEEHAGLAFKE